MPTDDEDKAKQNAPNASGIPGPKSATGTMLGVPKPQVGAAIPAPSRSAPSDPSSTRRDPNVAMPLDVPDLAETSLPALSTGTGTVKGMGPRAAPPARPRPATPSFGNSTSAPPSSAAPDLGPGVHGDPDAGGVTSGPSDASPPSPRAWAHVDDDALSSPIRLPGSFLMELPRRTLYIAAGGVGVVFFVLIIAVATCSGGSGDDDTAVADGSSERADGEGTDGEGVDTPDDAVDLAAPAEEPLPEPPTLTPAQTRELTQLRTTARARFAAGRFDDAAGLYRRAIAIDASQAAFYAGLGASLAEAGDVGGAIDAYTMACRLAPDSSGFHAALGRVYRGEGNTEAALAHYARALELDADNQAAKRAIRELSE